MTDQQIEELINEVQKRPTVWNKWSPLYKNRLAVDKDWEAIAAVLQENKDRLKGKWKNLRDVFQKEIKKIKKPRSGDPGSPSENYTGKWCYFQRMYFLKDTVFPRPTEGNYSENSFETNTSTEPNESQTQNEHSEQLTQQETANEMPETSQFIEQSTQEIERFTQEMEHPTHQTSQFPPSKIQTQPSLHSLPAASGSSSKNKKRKNEPQITPFEKEMLLIEEKKISALRNTTDGDPDMLFLKSLHPFFKELSPHRKLIVPNQMQNILAEAMSANSSFPYNAPSPQQASNSSHSDTYTYTSFY